MILLAIVLLARPLSAQTGPTVQTGAISQQARSNDCAVNIAAVSGKAIVNCPGVPASALRPLIREFEARRLSEEAARREAEKWRQNYEQLQSSLADAGLSQALRQRAYACLKEGDLKGAEAALDQEIKQEGQQVQEAARTHYLRGKVAELAFDRKTELEQYGVAYRLLPRSIEIALDYGNLLDEYGHPAEAEAVFNSLLEDASQVKAANLEAATTLSLGGSLGYQGRFEEGKEKSLEAASMFDLLSKKHEKSAICDEAVALSDAAEMARMQSRFAEAEQLTARAISLSGQCIDEELDPATLKRLHLTHAKFLLLEAEIDIDLHDLGDALKISEEAEIEARRVSSTAPTKLTKSIHAGALRVRCQVLEAQRKFDAAQGYCNESIGILDPLKGADGGAFDSDLAETLLTTGTVQEDRKLYGQAVESYQSAEVLWTELVERGQDQYRGRQTWAALRLINAARYSGNIDAAKAFARRAVLLSDRLPPALIDLHVMVLFEASWFFDQIGERAEAAEYRERRDALVKQGLTKLRQATAPIADTTAKPRRR